MPKSTPPAPSTPAQPAPAPTLAAFWQQRLELTALGYPDLLDRIAAAAAKGQRILTLYFVPSRHTEPLRTYLATQGLSISFVGPHDDPEFREATFMGTISL